MVLRAPSSRNCSEVWHVSYESILDMLEAGPLLWCTNLCISVADVLMPRHRSSMTPATATQSKNLVLVRKVHIALVGGRLALATFQLMPPFGRSMVKRVGWPATPPRDGLAAVQLKPRSAQGMCRDVSACGRSRVAQVNQEQRRVARLWRDPLKSSQ